MTAEPGMQEEPEIQSKAWRICPRKDQGEIPKCTGTSMRNMLDSAPYTTKFGPSDMDIYLGAQFLDEWQGEGYDGSSILGACRFTEKLGYIEWYGWGQRADDGRRWLLLNGPILLGIRWTDGMFYPDEKTHLIRPTGRTVGGHAIQSYRYDHRQGVFWLHQSWGYEWGKNGLACIQGEDLDMLIAEGGELATIRERRVPFAPVHGRIPASVQFPQAALAGPGRLDTGRLAA